MKKKVLHILSSGNFAGAENVAINIIENTSEQFESFYLSSEGNIGPILGSKNINYMPVSKLTPFAIRTAVKRIKPDVVHAHDFTASVMVAFTIFSTKIVSHIHQNPPWLLRFSLPSIIYFLSCFRYKSIIFVSDWIYAKKSLYRLFSNKIYVIENYVDLDLIRKKSREFNPLVSHQFDLIFVGRLSEVKNPLRFIQIINKIRAHKPDIKAAIVGGGELEKLCQEEIKLNALDANIKLYGFQKNPYVFVRNAKIQVITSKWEGFGLVAVEALALGKPIVASKVGGLKKIVRSNVGNVCIDDDEFVLSILAILKQLNDGKSYVEDCFTVALEYDNKSIWLKKLVNAMN